MTEERIANRSWFRCATVFLGLEIQCVQTYPGLVPLFGLDAVSDVPS
ncbi:hypothetical protein [Mycobacterium sp. Root265]|nr:hypothetical protein [Mycobacterium sp. Root265]